MEVALTLLGPALFGVFVFALVKLQHRSTYREIRPVLEEVARRTGGEFTDTTKPHLLEEMTARATIRGSRVTCNFGIEGSGKSARFVVRAVVSFGPYLKRHLHIYPETLVFSSIGKLLGGQDIQCGHVAYDTFFIIKGHDEGWVRSILKEPLTSAHLARPKVEITLKEGDLVAKHIGQLHHAEEVLDLMEFVTYFADAIIPPVGNMLEDRGRF